MAVFDLVSPVTIVMPDPQGRFQSLLVIDEDGYNPADIRVKSCDRVCVITRRDPNYARIWYLINLRLFIP
jgi:hypothetical protein